MTDATKRIREQAQGVLRILRKRDSRIISIREPLKLIESALLEARDEALEEAANEIQGHWNNSETLCNQKQQAIRSAVVIRSLKSKGAGK